MKNLGIALAVTTALTLCSNASGVQKNNKNIDINQYIKYRSSITSDKSVSKINIRLRKGIVKPQSDFKLAKRDLRTKVAEEPTAVVQEEIKVVSNTTIQESKTEEIKEEVVEEKDEVTVHTAEVPEVKPADVSLSGEVKEKPVKEEVTEEVKKPVKEEKVEEEKPVIQEEIKVVTEDNQVKEEVTEDKEVVEEKVEKKDVVEEVEDNSYSLSGYTIDTLNVRSSNNTSSKVIGVLKPGESVEGIHENGWIKINFNGVIGYVSEAYVDVKPAADEVVAVETEPVVEEPIQEEPVYEEPEQEIVVEEPKQDIESGSMQGLISDAYNLLGSPYVFGASSVGTGFDCSGLTSYLYQKHFGVYIGRITTDQIYSGYEVGVGNMQVGDLICFQNNWSNVCDHVAIYAGDGLYIHAADESRGVVTDSIYGSYFQNNVVSVRRIIN